MALHISAPRAAETGSSRCACGCSNAAADRTTESAGHTVETAITGDVTVRDVLTAHPAAVSVLHTYGIDTCCGAGASLHDAALTAGAELNAVLISLDAQFGSRAPGTRSV